MLDGYGSIVDFPKVLPKIPTIIQSAGETIGKSIIGTGPAKALLIH
jgi:hypothetical protein